MNTPSLKIAESSEYCTWDEYFKKVHKHSLRDIQSFKWIYDENDFGLEKSSRLKTDPCLEAEAELYMPFDHIIYTKTREVAKRKFRVFEREYCIDMKYKNDSDCLFDWTHSQFS